MPQAEGVLYTYHASPTVDTFMSPTHEVASSLQPHRERVASPHAPLPKASISRCVHFVGTVAIQMTCLATKERSGSPSVASASRVSGCLNLGVRSNRLAISPHLNRLEVNRLETGALPCGPS